MISEKHKFIYIAINKCASSSIVYSLRRYIKKLAWHEHQLLSKDTSASSILKCIKSPIDDYYKFTFVRNPFDRLLSNYFYRVREKKSDVQNQSFKEWVLNKEDKRSFKSCLMRFTMMDWVTDERGNNKMDFIGRVENLENDFEYVCNKINLKHDFVGKRNKSVHESCDKYYDEELIAFVENYYKVDFDEFGYKFGE